MLSRQGNTRAYAPDASDPVRLVGQIAAILSIASGVIHISAAGDHTDLPVMFAGFMLVAVLQIGLGALLISRPPSRLLIAAAIAMTISSIGLWVLSRTTGIPFVPGGHKEPVGFKDGITKLFEIASIPVLLLMLSKDLARVSVPPRLGTRAITVLGTACLALMPPALLSGHTHPHAESMAMGVHDEHSTGTEVAHAGTHASDHATEHSTQHTGGHPHGSSAHSTGDHSVAGHQHSHVELASAPLGATHQHGAPDTQAESHTHHSGSDDGAEHHVAHHRDRPHANHHGGGGHGGHDGHGDHGGEPGSQDAITISYEPSPSVCVSGAICIP